MSKPIAKITVRCPHCASQQQEPEQAKSTFCRHCSEYFAISAGVLASSAKRPAGPVFKERGTPGPAPKPGAPSFRAPVLAATGFKEKLEHLIRGKPKHRLASCFECSDSHEVSSSAHSSTCRACGAYIDLQDYKITGSFSRNIMTRGSVYLGSKGDLSSSKVICSSATLHGKMRGTLLCDGKVTIRIQGRLPGTLEAAQLVIERGSDVAFSRPVKVFSAEIAGGMTGQIISQGNIAISKHGSLEGPVAAAGFTVEKGGCFQGELTISPRGTLLAAAPAKPEEQRSPSPARGSVDAAALLAADRKPALG